MKPVNIRKELLPKRKKVAKAALKQLIADIELAYGLKEDCEELMTKLNDMLPEKLALRTVVSYYGVYSLDEFIQDITTFPPVIVEDIKRKEVIEILDYIHNGHEDPKYDSNLTHYLRLLDEHFPNADVSDLIYWPSSSEYLPEGREKFTIEEIADILYKTGAPRPMK